MKTKVILVAVAALTAATVAWAQESVATLQDLTGNVLVSREAGLSAGVADQGIANGTRIITTANSEVVVAFKNGCRVRLRENQKLEVDSKKVCAALIPESLAAIAPAIGPPVVGNVIVPGIIIGGTLIPSGGGSGGSTPVSPN